MTKPVEAPADLGQPFPWSRGTYDPSPVYEFLRENEPIKRVIMRDGTPAWLVTRYDDVRAILGDPRVSAAEETPGFPQSVPGFPVSAPEDRLFLRMDPPRHTVFRRLLGKHFVVKRIDALRPRIQQLVDDQLDAMLAKEAPVDFVREFALPVPSTVISWVLGVHPEDHPFFNRESEKLLEVTAGNISPENIASSLQARANLMNLIDELVKEREVLDDPGDDILGDMVRASREEVIDRRDIINTGWLLLVAGHETTASMTALGTLTLLEHPDQLAELRANPELIPAAIEELLRYLSIVHLIIMRIAAEDIEIGGVTIPAGEGIIPLNISANRDDAHYPNAASLDIHRNVRDHFAFGYGVHQCIGQPLARAELHVIFETLLRRVPTLSLAIDPSEVPFKTEATINGVFNLPVKW
ncbi:cytochrome P450 [Mycolicibacterium sp.]|uniref:cytochrome P450 n=1 Tax=Mycolicibacterium sp. TaxID=2320850 RepID=UPI003D0C1092